MAINGKIRGENLQCDINREAAKISTFILFWRNPGARAEHLTSQLSWIAA